MSDWSVLRQKFANVKPRGKQPFYDRVIKACVQAGFRLADDEMEALYAELVQNYGWPSTYPQIRQTQPNKYGIYAYATHARSEDIFDAVEAMAELHQGDAGRAWLMPVEDDDEYVSWAFDVIVGSREEVLAALRGAVASPREASKGEQG